MARKPKLSSVQQPLEALRYVLSGPRPRLVFTPAILAHFSRYRQHGWRTPEAGGQLFASFRESEIVVEAITGPYPKDKQSRFQFVPDRVQEQKDIEGFFVQKFHFIGNWHTHPQATPYPSRTDLVNTRARFALSDHSLDAFISVIVGLKTFPEGLYVALICRHHLTELKVEPST